MPLAINQILRQRYQIQALLGQGGFGAVYRAWDLNLQRWCAVKENLDASAPAQQQFQREATMLSRLRHANLPLVHDYFIEPNGQQYLVMELVEGQSLEAMVNQRGILSETQAVAWLTQILDALDYLHSQQPPIIHRDIKPANILITPQGKAVLVDFGIAKAYVAGQRTTIGARAITPGYSPPEQYGQAGVITDHRSDIYAIGATLYFLLTGIEPPESVQRVVGAPMTPINPQISANVRQAVQCAMELNPQARFQNAAAMRRALTTPIAQVRPTLQTSPSVIAKPVRKSKTSGVSCLIQILILGILALLAIGSVVMGGTFFLSMRAPLPILTPTRVVISPTFIRTDWLKPIVTPTDTPFLTTTLVVSLTTIPTATRVFVATPILTRIPEPTNSLTPTSRPISKRPLDATRYGNHYYKLYEDRLNWEQARKHCIDLDGYLAVITTKTENDFVWDLIKKRSFPEWTTAWLGATDMAKEGKWEWTTGEPFNLNELLIIDGGTSENYLNLRLHSGLWEDYPLEGETIGQQWSICEWNN